MRHVYVVKIRLEETDRLRKLEAHDDSPLWVHASPPLDVEHARKLMLRAVLRTSQPEMGVERAAAGWVDMGRKEEGTKRHTSKTSERGPA